MTNAPLEFATEEFHRYAAECRRMAALAQRRVNADALFAGRAEPVRRTEPLAQTAARLLGPRRRPARLVPGWAHP
jgi:hypothetical protein